MLICSCELTKTGHIKYCLYHQKQFKKLQTEIKALERSIEIEQHTIKKMLYGDK